VGIAAVGLGSPPLPRAHAQGASPPDILSFYASAHAITQSPPDESTLSIICQQMLSSGDMKDYFVSFIADRSKKVLLAAWSKKELTRVVRAISLKDWVSGRTEGEDAVDWVYVFDRNRDGKIDYIAFPVGFLPVEPKELPPNLPKRMGGFTSAQFLYLRRIGKLIFLHYADDAFTGTISAVVFLAVDPESDYLISGGQLIRSSRLDGMLDECWYFDEAIGRKSGDCESSGDGYRTRMGLYQDGFATVGPQQLAGFSGLLSALNESAEACRLAQDSFR
jgi:hypothetical protein